MYAYSAMSNDIWTLQSILTAPDATDLDSFGARDIKISDDILMVSSVFDDDRGASSGSVYVYMLSTVTSAWSLNQKLAVDTSIASDSCGSGIGLYGDYALIGCPGDDDGGTGAGNVL
jgi:hypothetical protein